MTPQIFFVLSLIVAIAIVLVTNKLRPDLAALLLLVVLGLTRLVSPTELFSGFSRAAVITILSLFIITSGLEQTGATRVLGQQLRQLAGENETRAIVVIMIATALLSLFMNTIAAAAVLLPAVVGISRQSGLRVGKLLMPLSFAALLGGMATLFTTANILVSAALADQGLKPYGVLDFIPVGLPMALAGIGFMAFFGRRLLPEADPGRATRAEPGRNGDLAKTYALQQMVSAVYVKPGSALAGLSLGEGGWGKKLGLTVVAISRGGIIHLAPAQSEKVIEGDVILFTGLIDDEEAERYGLIFTEEPAWDGRLASDKISLVEAVLAPRSAVAGQSLRDINFREKFDLTILAIWREGVTLREGLADLPLRFGDALLIQGQRSRIALLRREPDFLVLEEDLAGIESPWKAALAVGLTLAAVLLPAFNLLPIAEATFASAVLMILFNCLSMDEAYRAIEWKAIFLIAGMLPLGLAMKETGAADLLGNQLVGLLGNFGPLAIAGGIFLLTTLLTQVMSGQATAVILAPIAIMAARRVGVDPRGLVMAAAMGCSMAFLTPFGHATNLLVMGPGGYTVKDYARVGLPLTLVLFVILLLTLPVFWGIR